MRSDIRCRLPKNFRQTKTHLTGGASHSSPTAVRSKRFSCKVKSTVVLNRTSQMRESTLPADEKNPNFKVAVLGGYSLPLITLSTYAISYGIFGSMVTDLLSRFKDIAIVVAGPFVLLLGLLIVVQEDEKKKSMIMLKS